MLYEQDRGKVSEKQSKITSPNVQQKRNSAIEMLRIFAMLAIVLSHACVHGGFDLSTAQMSFNRFAVQWGTLGNLGVDIFVIISGFFLCVKETSAKSLSKLFVQLWFYSIALFLLCKFGFGYTYTLRQYLKVFLPTLFAEYWFFTAYIVLAIFSPYLNILIKTVTRRQLQVALFCMIVMWVIIPTFTMSQLYGAELPQFVMLYTIGAYFRKYPDNIFNNKAIRVMVTIFSFILLILSTVIVDYFAIKFAVFQNRGTLFYERNSLLIVGSAVGLFALAAYHKPFFNSLINTISGCTFGVYLIHENPAVREMLWKQWLPLANYFDSVMLPLMIVGAVVTVFSVCTLIEFLRQKTVAKSMTKMLDSCKEKVAQLAKRLWDRKKSETLNM